MPTVVYMPNCYSLSAGSGSSCRRERRFKLKAKTQSAFLLCVTLLASVPLFAHHSGAMFDNTKWMTFKGTVVEYIWENPHTHIIVKVPPGASDPSTVGTWDIEGSAVNIMSRQGWTKISYRAGDPIALVAHPMRDGSKGASLSYAILPDGSHRYMNEGRPDVPPPDKAGN